MLTFTTRILKFDKQGEKTGWSYIHLTAAQARQLKDSKVSFRVKGKLDSLAIRQVALLPMGKGDFIIPLNGDMRKQLRKEAGDTVKVSLQYDKEEFKLNADLMLCLEDEPASLKFFQSLPGSHQRYFSKWIDSAKSESTKAKRIAMALNAFSRKKGFAEMIREEKRQR
ncbi:MAG: YdeI/OmpD-associated family protein [Cyclobacteriaceae bacterium]